MILTLTEEGPMFPNWIEPLFALIALVGLLVLHFVKARRSSQIRTILTIGRVKVATRDHTMALMGILEIGGQVTLTG